MVWLELLLITLPYELVRPSKEEVLESAIHVALKDAPIVAAARKAKVDLLVTMDQKHILGKPELANYAGLQIVTPKEAMAILRR